MVKIPENGKNRNVCVDFAGIVKQMSKIAFNLRVRTHIASSKLIFCLTTKMLCLPSLIFFLSLINSGLPQVLVAALSTAI